jgi:hypothetical protein
MSKENKKSANAREWLINALTDIGVGITLILIDKLVDFLINLLIRLLTS